MHPTLTRCLLLLTLAASSAATAAEPKDWPKDWPKEWPKEWRFTALLDGKPIGYHNFKLVETDGKRELTSEARFNVKLLFVSVYKYVHDDKEIYRGDCLDSIDARTNDNGTDLIVKGSLDVQSLTQSFSVSDGKSRKALGPCIMTFAYWNPHILEQKQLLNSQTGKYEPVKIEKLADETVMARGKQAQANKYVLTGDKLKIELWYSKDMQWLGLQSTAEGGRKLLYRMD